MRPALEDGVSQAQVACTHNISKSIIGRWVKYYREVGLANVQVRPDKGKSRRLPAEAVNLIGCLKTVRLMRHLSFFRSSRHWVVSIHCKPCRIERSETGVQRESVESQTVRCERISAHRSILSGFMLNWLCATMLHALRTHCANAHPRMRARSIPSSSLS